MTSNRNPFSSRSRYQQVTTCPCCGVKFAGDFSNGCASCGARSVGEPLPKPEHELPSYARALVLAIMGSLMVMAVLIGISIPTRLRNRQDAFEAGYDAHVQRLDRAFFEYGIRYNTLPSEPQDLLKGLPDPDGSLAAALREVGPLAPGAYKPSG